MSRTAELVDLETAVAFYQQLPMALHAGSLHPLYVVADAARDAELQPVFWCFESGGDRLIHGFHLSTISGSEWRDIQSPYGYGGPLATTDDAGFLNAADAAFVQWAVGNGVVAEFLRFHPMLENWKYYGGQHELDRETIWIDCTRQDLLMSYEVRQRTAIRKAINAGVETRWLDRQELQDVFPDFYLQAMRAIQAAEFYHFTPRYFEQLLALPFVSGIAAYWEGMPIAMSLFMGDGFGEYHLSGKTVAGAQYSATSMLLHKAATGMGDKGLGKLYLGGGTTSGPDDSLFFFKRGFSTERAEFRIGKRVFMPEAYEHLKQRHATLHARHPQRVLFYRSS